ncbi:MAG: hypothetical protein IJR98_02595 [Synergistaceae bacterium]|nr:hypothetical protein [Synergistaceae bacterium]
MPVNFIIPKKDYSAVEALRELGRISELRGKDKITLEEIDAEIAAFRAGR